MAHVCTSVKVSFSIELQVALFEMGNFAVVEAHEINHLDWWNNNLLRFPLSVFLRQWDYRCISPSLALKWILWILTEFLMLM